MCLQVEEAGCFEGFCYGESDSMFIGWGPCEEWAEVDQLEQIRLVVA
jgi:hypothetical protein